MFREINYRDAIVLPLIYNRLSSFQCPSRRLSFRKEKIEQSGVIARKENIERSGRYCHSYRIILSMMVLSVRTLDRFAACHVVRTRARSIPELKKFLFVSPGWFPFIYDLPDLVITQLPIPSLRRRDRRHLGGLRNFRRWKVHAFNAWSLINVP